MYLPVAHVCIIVALLGSMRRASDPDRHALDLVAFDADDTLWHNERSYRDARAQFCRMLNRTGIPLTPEVIDVHVNRTEAANIQHYGYGVSSFVLSLIETAMDLTDGRISVGDLRGVIDLAKAMHTEEIELFPGVRDLLRSLAARYPLLLITKGQLLHQTSKLDRSGLRDCFQFVEVVSHKTPEVYRAILSRHGVDPARFVMIGNSLKSDILPVLETGGWAVHVPAELSWSHEDADLPAAPPPRYFTVPAIDHLPAVIATIEQAITAARGGVRKSPSRRSAAGAGRRRPAAGNRRS
jgi:putative hydrolase of the HAD superfamily